MPQPLSRVKSKANISIGARELGNHHPENLQSALRVIAHWSEIDSDVAILVSQFLKSDVETGMAMYQALSGGAAKRAVALAASKSALPEWQFLLFQAIGKATQKSREQRNIFAHGVWAYSEDIPQASLLVPLSAIIDRTVRHKTQYKSSGEGAQVITFTDYDRSKIMVYRQSDFHAAVSEADNAAFSYFSFWHLLRHRDELARRWLLNAPGIAQALRPLLIGSSQATQLLLRSPEPDEAPPEGLIIYQT